VHYLCDEANGWMPDLGDIRRKITPATKGIVVINPNNPTARCIPTNCSRELVAIAREHNLVIFADEVYDKVLYDGAKHTGHREPVGRRADADLQFAVQELPLLRLPRRLAGGLGRQESAADYIEGLNMLSNMRLCANVPGQWAIQTALGGYQSINELVAEGGRLRRQRDLAYELITAIPGVTCVKPTAALYMFPRLDPKVYPIADDRQFFLELLQETRVMLVQGTGFNWAHAGPFPHRLPAP
jgi:alanine-synthesizing transaminase